MDLFISEDLGSGFIEADNFYFQQYQTVLSKLITKRVNTPSDAQFLKQIFFTVHRKVLGNYQQYVTFDELFQEGQKYDCVTGTALYALILDYFGFEYDIHETDYHVYLVAHTADQRFLFESTDPIYGFASQQEEIKQRIAAVNIKSKTLNERYLKVISSNDEGAQNIKIIDNIVSIGQLSGLHYYNQGLKYFNEGNYRDAFKMTIVAQGIYPSMRIKNASSFIFSMAFED